MADTLLSAMERYAKSGRRRLHTPGHKGRIMPLDITELGVDGNIFPGDLIGQAESKAATYFGAKSVRFLTGGSSLGLKAAIMTANCDCIVGADSHRAVFEGLELAGRKAIIIQNEMRDGLALPLTPAQIERAAKDNPRAGAAVITSPTYFGIAADPAAYMAVGLKIIADSAHGAHFPAGDIFPKGFSGIADYCVLSGHKTLDTLTQGAYLCVNGESADHALKLLGTTSPSYLILASLEYGVESAQNANIPEVLVEIEKFKKEFTGFYCHCEKAYADEAIRNKKYSKADCFVTARNDDLLFDPFRVAVDASQLGMTGFELADKERARGVECELATDRHVVYIFTFADSPSG